VKIALAIAIVLTVAYVVFQAIAQQSIIDWILDRFDDDDNARVRALWSRTEVQRR
jgi:hypothetical protein